MIAPPPLCSYLLPTDTCGLSLTVLELFSSLQNTNRHTLGAMIQQRNRDANRLPGGQTMNLDGSLLWLAIVFGGQFLGFRYTSISQVTIPQMAASSLRTIDLSISQTRDVKS